MKKTWTKGIALLLAMLLITASFAGCTAYDENYAIFELWVAGVKVTTRNQADILGDGTVSYAGDGKSGVLTLNGANIAESSDSEAIILSLIDDLTIQLVGENQIGMGEKAPVDAISALNLVFRGEGSLALGARASCVTANMILVDSGKIDTYIKTAEDEVASFIGVGFWAQELLAINGGDIQVHYAPAFSALSYGLYCAKDLTVNGGNIEIRQEEAAALAIGIISSEKLTISGGDLTIYGNDDAMNAKTFSMTGGTVNASAVDVVLLGFNPETWAPVMGSDGVCRLVHKAEFSGGCLTLTALERVDLETPTFLSNDLTLLGMTVKGGDNSETLEQKDTATYTYTDTCIRIEKEAN